jgi:hypothetical protein
VEVGEPVPDTATVLARVGAGVVTQEQLDLRSKLAKLEAERFVRPIPERGKILQELIDEELLVQDAVRAGFLTLDQDVRSRLIQRVLAERAGVEAASRPSEATLRAFYEEHADLIAERQRQEAAARALGDYRFAELANDESFHDHLDEPEGFCAHVRQRLFPELREG